MSEYVDGPKTSSTQLNWHCNKCRRKSGVFFFTRVRKHLEQKMVDCPRCGIWMLAFRSKD